MIKVVFSEERWSAGVELVNDLSGYQLIFPLPLHVIGTFFLRVNERRLWNTL